MIVEISQWGNSLGMRIPKPIAQALGLKKNSRARLKMEDGKLILEPEHLQDSDFFSSPVDLKALTNRINSKNKPELQDDKPAGKEIW